MPADKHFGFTGTQEGMTERQLYRAAWVVGQRPGWWHHGDCVGADLQLHKVLGHLGPGWKRVIHPPKVEAKRAFCVGDMVYEPKDYLVRNHDIVDLTGGLLAAPAGMEEEIRSGTWSTVRYARKKGRPILIVYPDGSFVPDTQSTRQALELSGAD